MITIKHIEGKYTKDKQEYWIIEVGGLGKTFIEDRSSLISLRDQLISLNLTER